MPLLLVGLVAIAATWLAFERGGLIAWATLLLALALGYRQLRRPAPALGWLALSLAVIAVITWLGTRAWVIATWESGEVVTLTIEADGTEHRARLWVMDLDDGAHLYYDAPPAAAQTLLAGEPVRVQRGGATRSVSPTITLADALPREAAQRLQDAMTAKYGDRNRAATVYYLLLGRPRDRTALVLRLP